MNREDPLANPRLRSVESALDSGKLDDAQALLAELGQMAGLEPGTSFLAARLLYLRGRLSSADFAQRLRDLLRDGCSFPKAEQMLLCAENGTLGRFDPDATAASAPRSRRATSLAAGADGVHWVPDYGRMLDQESSPASQRLELGWSSSTDTNIKIDASRSTLGEGSPHSPGAHAERWAVGNVPSNAVGGLAGPVADSPFPELPDSLEPPPVVIEPGLAWAERGPAVASEGPEPDRLGTHDVRLGLPVIPRAPGVPRFTPPPDPFPSYSPPRALPEARLDDPPPESPRSRPGVPASPLTPRAGLAQSPKASSTPTQARPSRPRNLPTPRLAVPEIPAFRRHLTPGQAAPVDPLGPAGRMHPVGHGEEAGRADRIMPPVQPHGRYSGAAREEEIVWSRTVQQRRIGEPAPLSSPGPAPRVTPRSPQRPSDEARPIPSLFDVVNLLDEGRFELAIRALDHDGRTPEEDLLRARALSGLGRNAEARAALEELCEGRPLDPELRAGAARLLVEVGAPERALHEGRLALDQAAESPLVRITVAWAAMRLARRSQASSLVTAASAILDGLKTRGGPNPALVLALRACVHAFRGENERAVAVAQRALVLDPRAADAWAALAWAAAKMGRRQEANQALLRLRDYSAGEAQVLEPQLVRLGVSQSPPEQHHLLALARFDDSESTWDAMELALLAGESAVPRDAFERTCRERLNGLAERSQDDSFGAIAQLAAQVMTGSPVFTHFAPYDFTPASVARLDAALDTLYCYEEARGVQADDFPSLLLMGSYLGEVSVRTAGGEWHGSVLELREAATAVPGGRRYPFQEILARIREARPLDVQCYRDNAASAATVPHIGADPGAIPQLWGPGPWPRVDDIPRLGRAFCRSVTSLWCARRAGGPLDGSPGSVVALDRYLDLIAIPQRSGREPEPWAVRGAVLAGAYLGEVLRVPLRGAWANLRSVVPSPESYRLRVLDTEITPIAQVLARLTGRDSESLREYVARYLP